MEHDEQRLADTRDWLVRAEQDLSAAELLIGAEPPLTSVAAFHCQQAAEKALKALLFWHDVPFRKTHELEELADECARLEPSLTESARAVVDLTPFAWRFRYPGDLDEPDSGDVEGALSRARTLHEAVSAVLRES